MDKSIGTITALKMEENKIQIIKIEKAIVGSNWCIKCWPIKDYATVIYKGNSLCEKHFKQLDELCELSQKNRNLWKTILYKK